MDEMRTARLFWFCANAVFLQTCSFILYVVSTNAVIQILTTSAPDITRPNATSQQTSYARIPSTGMAHGRLRVDYAVVWLCPHCRGEHSDRPSQGHTLVLWRTTLGFASSVGSSPDLRWPMRMCWLGSRSSSFQRSLASFSCFLLSVESTGVLSY